MSETTTTPQECPVCDSNRIEANVYDLNGICEECGFVLDKRNQIDVPQWAVDASDETATGQEGWFEFCRVTNSTEQQLAEAFGLIEKIASLLPMTVQMRKEASNVYAAVFRSKATDGRDTKNMIAACLRVASRNVDRPVPRSRLTEINDVSSSAFRKCVIAICNATEQDPSPLKPTDYLWFLQQSLNLEETEIEATSDTLRGLEETDVIAGKNPSGVAAAGVYATINSLTQKAAADAVGVSTETIRLRTKDIREHKQ